jgi:hypothetical protein
VENLTPNPEQRVAVQIVGDPARFLAGHKAAVEAATQLLTPMAAISKAVGASMAFKVAQDCGPKNLGSALFGIKPPSDIGSALFGKHIARNIGANYAKQFAGIAGIGKAVSGLAAASDSVRHFGKLLQDLERAKRGAIARYRRAAYLLNDLPDDATFGESRKALEILALGDTRLLRRLMIRLAARAAQGDGAAAAMLAWLGAILDVLAADAAAQHVAASAAIANRWIAHHLGGLEWRLRAPDRHADPVAHRQCANAPNGASIMEAAAA